MKRQEIPIVGIIDKILPLELKGQNKDFKVQSLILIVDDSYKKDGMIVERSMPLKIDFKQKNTEQLSEYMIGTKVAVEWNLKGSKWQNTNMEEPRYYTTAEGWKIAEYIENTEQVEELTPFPELDNHKADTQAQFPKTDSPSWGEIPADFNRKK